jgi:hypothetical protein
MNIPRPYKEIKTSGYLLREFGSDSDPDDLIWHKDRNDRIVKVVKSNGWKLQLANGLPFTLKEGSSYKIPALSWHRILKGEGSLLVKIKESSEETLLRLLIKEALLIEEIIVEA